MHFNQTKHINAFPEEHKISKYYNKKDFALAKKAISEMKKGNWTVALQSAKKTKDKDEKIKKDLKGAKDGN